MTIKFSEADDASGGTNGSKKEFHPRKWEVSDDIVISGISGRFPESDSVDEFADNLFRGVNLVSKDDRRWPVGKS